MSSSTGHAKPARSSIFDAWGRPLYRRRQLVLARALLFAGVWGTGIFAKVQTAGGFGPPRPLRRLYVRYGIHEDDSPESGALLPAREPAQA